MGREVVDDDLEAVGDAGVLQQVAPLASVGTGGVLAEQADALAGRLVVDAVVEPVELEVDVAPDRGVVLAVGGLGRAPERGAGSVPLAAWRSSSAKRRTARCRPASAGGGSTVIAPTPAAAKGSV